MDYCSISHDSIISAFLRNVPGSYVRDYRDSGGYIVVCRDYRDIPWKDQASTRRVERRVPAVTLVNLPKGYVTPATKYAGVRMVRPGWREQFRKAARHLSESQKRRITKALHLREAFPGVVV